MIFIKSIIAVNDNTLETQINSELLKLQKENSKIKDIKLSISECTSDRTYAALIIYETEGYNSEY